MLLYINQLQEKVDIEMFGGGQIKEMATTSGKTGRAQPQIRWFFAPRHETSDIPKSTIVIDGYCTDVDESSDEEEEESGETRSINHSHRMNSDDNNNISAQNNSQQKRIPDWKSEVEHYITTSASTHHSLPSMERKDDIHHDDNDYYNHKNPLHRERHRFTILSTFESVNGNENSSGYLLKQSNRDKNIWKRVHCVLTEDQFWFVSRVKKIGGAHSHNKNNSKGSKNHHNYHHGSRIGKHGIINLNGSLFLEPSTFTFDSPLSGIPNTFQLTTRKGEVHVFQAGNKNAYLRWCECLSERIVICQENSTFDVTDAMISRETWAKQKRCERYLFSALLFSGPSPSSTSTSSSPSSTPQSSKTSNKDNNYAGRENFLTNYKHRGNDNMKYLINLGLQIAEYKEQCKQAHLQYAYSLSVASRNLEDPSTTESKMHSPPHKQQYRLQHSKDQSEWLVQSFTSWNIAKSLLKCCHKTITMLLKTKDINDGKNVNNSSVHVDIIEVQNEIKQRLFNFEQKQEQLHRGDKINPESNGNNAT